MAKRQSFLDRIATGNPLVIDGAMGTELTRKGYTFNSLEWLRANIDSPGCISEVHADYAKSGAELHIANSFATGLHVLEHFDLSVDFESLNRAAVSVCMESVTKSAPHDQWIAGSISTFAHDHDRNNLPPLDKLELNVARQAEILAEAGCDLIALEMLFDVEHTISMLNGASRSGLPISVGFVCMTSPEGEATLKSVTKPGVAGMGPPVNEVISRVMHGYSTNNELIMTVMHSEIDDTGPALSAIHDCWDGASAAYPNNGKYVPPGKWDTDSGFNPAQFVDACKGWLAEGANMVGGCCGVGPDHIASLGQHLDRT